MHYKTISEIIEDQWFNKTCLRIGNRLTVNLLPYLPRSSHFEKAWFQSDYWYPAITDTTAQTQQTIIKGKHRFLRIDCIIKSDVVKHHGDHG